MGPCHCDSSQLQADMSEVAVGLPCSKNIEVFECTSTTHEGWMGGMKEGRKEAIGGWDKMTTPRGRFYVSS